jgi:hypothetical protein
MSCLFPQGALRLRSYSSVLVVVEAEEHRLSTQPSLVVEVAEAAP